MAARKDSERKTPNRRMLRKARKIERILELKEMSGLSVRAISKHLTDEGWTGVSSSRVHQLLAEGLEELLKSQRLKVEHWQQLELGKIDRVETAILPKLLQATDPEVIDRLMRALERAWKRRDALAGLTAPTKVEHTGADGGPIDTSTRIRVIMPKADEEAENYLDTLDGDDEGE